MARGFVEARRFVDEVGGGFEEHLLAAVFALLPRDSAGDELRIQPVVAFLEIATVGHLREDVGAAEKPIIVEQIPTAPAASDLGFEQLPGPRGVADDLKKLPGVSPAIEKQLNDLGIFHFTQIAELNEKAAHNIGEEVGLPGRVDGWIAKAKELTAE